MKSVALQLSFRKSPVAIALWLLIAPASRATIRYEVSLDHPEMHLFHVSMTIPDVSGSVIVQMPAWNALYQIRDFASHLQQVQAFRGNQSASIERLDKQTWRITATGTLTVRYASYWDDPGPFGTQLNTEHAFINPAMILLYLPDRRSEDVRLSLPDVPAAWQVAGASLAPVESRSGARNFAFAAPSYDALADAPIEAARFEEIQLVGLPGDIRVVIHGDNWKKPRLEDTLRRICAYQINLMGGAPFSRYTFIFHIGKAASGAGGGMEHANSTAISIPSDDFLAGVSAHEFLHLWNVKRIRPASLEPVDYTKEQYTRALWFAEGVTNTFASYTLVRTGLWSRQQFYADLSEQITELELRSANRWQSAEESSLDAWLEKYPLYNRPDHSVSYYTKGQILGFLLDILIRDRTGNRASLDDVLRWMNREFAQKQTPFHDSVDVQLAAEKVAGSSFEEFFRRYVAGAEPLPYTNVLALAGLEIHEAQRSRATLGFALERIPSGEWRIAGIEPESPAAAAGLRVGDLILRWNNAEPPRRLERWLREQKPGQAFRLRIRREEKEFTRELHLGEQIELSWQVSETSNPAEEPRRIREGLLQGVTQAATPP